MNMKYRDHTHCQNRQVSSQPHTFVMPYMVVGLMMVSSGVLCRGVLAPNTAMVLGAYTDSW